MYINNTGLLIWVLLSILSGRSHTAPTSLKFNAELAIFWNLNAKFRFLFVILFLKATELAKFWKLAKLLSKTTRVILKIMRVVEYLVNHDT